MRLEKTNGVEGAGSAIFYNPKINQPIEKQQQILPVYKVKIRQKAKKIKYKDSILYLMEKYQTLVILGETGSGKTTQIPQV